MKDRFYTLKDFELSNEKNAIERANDFQIYIRSCLNFIQK